MGGGELFLVDRRCGGAGRPPGVRALKTFPGPDFRGGETLSSIEYWLFLPGGGGRFFTGGAELLGFGRNGLLDPAAGGGAGFVLE